MTKNDYKTPVLFAEKNSIYHSLNCDVYDINRNAYTFSGKCPIIAHPPCRLWSKLRGLSTADQCEKLTGIFATLLVQNNGGVLEHPVSSQLWKFMNLPYPGYVDKYGGFTLCVNQNWFGSKVKKPTLLYFCGISINDLEPYPLNFDAIEYWQGTNSKCKIKHKAIKKSERSSTPIKMAEWLISNVKKINSKV